METVLISFVLGFSGLVFPARRGHRYHIIIGMIDAGKTGGNKSGDPRKALFCFRIRLGFWHTKIAKDGLGEGSRLRRHGGLAPLPCALPSSNGRVLPLILKTRRVNVELCEEGKSPKRRPSAFDPSPLPPV